MANRYRNNRYDQDRYNDAERERRSSGQRGYNPDYSRGAGYFGGGERGPGFGEGYIERGYDRDLSSFPREIDDSYSDDSYSRGYQPERSYGRDRQGYMRSASFGGGRNYGERDYGRQADYDSYGGGARYSDYPVDRDRYEDRYSERSFGYDRGYSRPARDEYYDREERGLWDRASDEVASWFGDEEAEMRRYRDKRQQSFRGRGPSDYKRSDDRIREDINDRLTDHDYLDASNISVKVDNCDVTLSGNVESRYAKRMAEDIAENVTGVGNVENRLRVKESWGEADRDIGSTASTTSNSSESAKTQSKAA